MTAMISSFVRLKLLSLTTRSMRSFSPPSSLTTLAGRDRVLPQLFVKLLPVAAFFDRLHHDVFGCHKGQLLHDPLGDHLGVDHQAVADVEQMFRMASTARKPSATEMRLLAQSSKVRSNHWVAEVKAGFKLSTITIAGEAK